jgi:hypothetical protein
MLLVRDVTAIKREIERGIGFAILAITIGQLAYEVGFGPALGPSFP